MINAASGPGVAAAQTAQGQPDSLEEAVPFQRGD